MKVNQKRREKEETKKKERNEGRKKEQKGLFNLRKH